MFHSLLDFPGRHVYHHDDCDDMEHQKICSNYMDIFVKNFLIKMSMMVFGYTCAMMGPTYSYLIQGIRTTTIEVKVPFTEERSYVEFSINMSIQMSYAIVGGLEYIGLEIMMDLFRNVITIAPALVHYRLNKYIREYKDEMISEPQLRFAFTSIMKQAVDADEYAFLFDVS